MVGVAAIPRTADALERYFAYLIAQGRSPATIHGYRDRLSRFARENPDIPTDAPAINRFLRRHGESRNRRGPLFKALQAFYSYLQSVEGIISPVAPKGPMGRPRLGRKKVVQPAESATPEASMLADKVVQPLAPEAAGEPISTLGAIDAYLLSLQAQGCAPRSIMERKGFLRRFANSYAVLPMSPEPIEKFLTSIKGVPETRWTYRRCLRALYRFLEKRRRIPRDLFDFPTTKVPRKVRRVLSTEEMAKLFRVCEDAQERCMLMVLIDSKIRIGELLSMSREKIFPDRIIVRGKTGERSVPIQEATYQALCGLTKRGALFQSSSGCGSRSWALKLIRAIMLRSGLRGPKLGPHILRHSASVLHIMSGGDLLSLQAELGHTTTRMTERYAALAFPDVKAKHLATDVLGAVVGRGASSETPPPATPQAPAAPLRRAPVADELGDLSPATSTVVIHRGKAPRSRADADRGKPQMAMPI